MTADELRERKHADPFMPFTLTLKTGRKVPVTGRFQFIVSPIGTGLIVTHAEVDVDMIRISEIAGVTEGLVGGVA